MFIVLNGPLGIGKSTLAEALMESLDGCVMLDGDALVSVNPAPDNAVTYLNALVALLVAHHRRHGYRHFVVNHIWRAADDLADLRNRLLSVDPRAEFRCFLLTLPEREHLRRIERRQQARAIDERESERRTFAEERQALANHTDLGEPFDVSAPISDLVADVRRRLLTVSK
jgi:thymidylate kinase